jgi:Chlorophyll A-B binding protein.
MQLAEIKHGRTAMMAVLFYGIEEMMTNHGVVPYL